MDGNKKPEGAEGPKKNLPPQVEKMLASAKEMETILTHKLTKIDAVSLEKSEMAKQEAMKIKADVEEIKRLSLIQSKEGEEALKAKIMEVNKRIETTTRKAAELQKQLVELHKQLLNELRVKSVEVKSMIQAISELSEEERSRMTAAVTTIVSQAEAQLSANQEIEKKLVELEHKVKEVKLDKNMGKDEVLKKLEQQLDLILAPSKPHAEEDGADNPGPGVFKAESRKGEK